MLETFLKSHGEYHDDKYFKDLTTLKMGGYIRHFVLPETVDDLKVIIAYLKSKRIIFKVIGNGSNLVCGESDYNGVVICLKKINSFEINNDELYVEAGVLAPVLAQTLAKQGLSCMEFASGIPGCIGGLIYMNAGAYRSSMSDVIREVLVLKDDELVWMNNDELQFSYRHSIFHDHPRWVVVAARLKLERKDPKDIEALMKDRLDRRKSTQPLDKPSAGSCFRNPDDQFAWKLIDGIGYRGFAVGDVSVSDKHSNFIVNNGQGTAEDYLSIACQIQDKVKEKYGIRLIMEVEKFNC
ncbi:MAG: UDP-N-acetylmuramate dehydrogenase [Erysipelotrichaceae bacterium]|nr:UDP-N-acetylmuramate dehydrogenase [Erysipelotrichaceae bacterium]MBQ5804536.1 UDP-N-acetylmuramate dehydrogenase [Erysipelotrichaceae bacterium]